MDERPVLRRRGTADRVFARRQKAGVRCPETRQRRFGPDDGGNARPIRWMSDVDVQLSAGFPRVPSHPTIRQRMGMAYISEELFLPSPASEFSGISTKAWRAQHGSPCCMGAFK